jgi:carbon storage regulator
VIVIPREEGEGVMIGDGVIVTVIEIREDKVRLAIEYPEDMTVQRGETRPRARTYQDVALAPSSRF